MSSRLRVSWWANHKLLSAAFVSAVIALALTAADQLHGASRALLAVFIALVLAAVTHTYSQLPETKKSSIASRRNLQRVAVVSVVLAAIVSCTFWFGGWQLDISVPIARQFVKLDFIPAAFSLILPFAWRSGLHAYFRDITCCFPGPFWWESVRYLRTAIPAYSVTFFAVILLAELVILRLQRRAG